MKSPGTKIHVIYQPQARFSRAAHFKTFRKCYDACSKYLQHVENMHR
ncbi:MAG: hypothetical protein ABSB40_11750 [Nitrososphaeria archaeon]